MNAQNIYITKILPSKIMLPDLAPLCVCVECTRCEVALNDLPYLKGLPLP